MENHTDNHYADASMMIRRPVSEVYKAFIDPEVTTQFWFSKSSAILTEGESVEWTWTMFDHTVLIKVLKLIENELIQIQWGDDPDVQVFWTFIAIDESKTVVNIKNTGFKGDQETLISQIRDSTGGFSLVVAGLKAWLEHGIHLNLVADKYPGLTTE